MTDALTALLALCERATPGKRRFGDNRLVTDEGTIVWGYAEAHCGRGREDYYACRTAKAEYAVKFRDQDKDFLLAATPEVFAVLVRVAMAAEEFQNWQRSEGHYDETRGNLRTALAALKEVRMSDLKPSDRVFVEAEYVATFNKTAHVSFTNGANELMALSAIHTPASIAPAAFREGIEAAAKRLEQKEAEWRAAHGYGTAQVYFEAAHAVREIIPQSPPTDREARLEALAIDYDDRARTARAEGADGIASLYAGVALDLREALK